MRTLKFRVWDKDNKKWWGDLSNQLIFGGTARYYNKFEPVLNYHKYDIQQFTGLLDLNKQEIYEGDIVETVEGIELGDKYINKGVVKYDEYFAAYGVASNLDSDCTDYFLDTGSCRYPKIIGNVFENPELLKELLK